MAAAMVDRREYSWSFPSSPALYRAIRCRRNSSRSSVKSHLRPAAEMMAYLTPHAGVESIEQLLGLRQAGDVVAGISKR